MKHKTGKRKVKTLPRPLVGQGIAELRCRSLCRQAELAVATRTAADASRLLLEACEHPLVFRIMAPVIRASCRVTRRGGRRVVAGAGRPDRADRYEVARVCAICGFREDREPDGDSMPWSSPPSEYEAYTTLFSWFSCV